MTDLGEGTQYEEPTEEEKLRSQLATEGLRVRKNTILTVENANYDGLGLDKLRTALQTISELKNLPVDLSQFEELVTIYKDLFLNSFYANSDGIIPKPTDLPESTELINWLRNRTFKGIYTVSGELYKYISFGAKGNIVTHHKIINETWVMNLLKAPLTKNFNAHDYNYLGFRIAPIVFFKFLINDMHNGQ